MSMHGGPRPVRPRPTWLARHTLHLPTLALLALSLALAGCAGASAESPDAPPPHHARIIYDGYQTAAHPSDWARVTFTADVSYAQSVALLANQGLYPYGDYCDGWPFTHAPDGTPPPGAIEMGIRWRQPSVNTLSDSAPTTHVIPV